MIMKLLTFSTRIFLFASLLLLVAYQPASGAQLPDGFAEEKIVDGLDPTRMVMAPDGRIFIAQKNGTVMIVKDHELLEDPFLEVEVDVYNERGLSGITLDPQFELNNYVYIYYTVPVEGRNRISRFTANGDYAIPNSEEILMDLDVMGGTIHNSGGMAFGPDGKLFVTVGDGANLNNAQDLNTTLGKVLRINSDGSIPADNPFYDELEGNNRAIWAYGLRNPYTMDMQPGTGRLFVNDVGQDTYEEVNDIEKGKNYGWGDIEGYLAGQIPPNNYKDPLHAYLHDPDCAVMGASFYNPVNQQFPDQYVGKYFFGDYCSGWIKVLDPNSGDITETFATGIDRPISILTAPDGSLYYIARGGMGGGSPQDNTSSNEGTLWRVFYTGSGLPFVSSQPEDILVPIGEDAYFEVSASGAQPLDFQWQKNGIDIPGATQKTLSIPGVILSQDGELYRCRVKNGEGEVWSEEATLSVTPNTRPVPVIELPTAGATYKAGETLQFSGYATDAEDGSIDASQLSWKVDFHHADHTHPALTPTQGISSGEFLIPIIGEVSDDVWYRVILTAEDSEGLTQSVWVDIDPLKTTVSVTSDPPGMQLSVDGKNVTTPYSFQSVIGVLRNLQAPLTQFKDGKLFAFKDWDNQIEDPLFVFQAPDDETSHKVSYEEVPLGDGDGLWGEYFNEEVAIFEAEPVFSRIDPVVDLDWDGSTPNFELLGDDYFNIRWTGFVEPYFTEDYSFFVISDDGVRLFIDDEPIIDQWIPQSPTETTGSIFLEAGKRYPIRLEYFELEGGAEVSLSWRSLRTPKEIIPQNQLYSPFWEETPKSDAPLQAYPLPANDWLKVFIRSTGRTESGELQFYDMSGRLLKMVPFSFSPPQQELDIDITDLAAGLYFLRAKGRVMDEVIKVAIVR
jgi:glucose/arabinose dehydrogenase